MERERLLIGWDRDRPPISKSIPPKSGGQLMQHSQSLRPYYTKSGQFMQHSQSLRPYYIKIGTVTSCSIPSPCAPTTWTPFASPSIIRTVYANFFPSQLHDPLQLNVPFLHHMHIFPLRFETKWEDGRIFRSITA
jgi:hypothetical protein